MIPMLSILAKYAWMYHGIDSSSLFTIICFDTHAAVCISIAYELCKATDMLFDFQYIIHGLQYMNEGDVLTMPLISLREHQSSIMGGLCYTIHQRFQHAQPFFLTFYAQYIDIYAQH